MSCKIPTVHFRQYQVDAIASFLNNDPTISNTNLFIQGASGTGKSYTIENFQKLNNDNNMILVMVNSKESVTWKPLIQSVARNVQFKFLELFPKFFQDFDMLDPLRIENPFHLIDFFNLFLKRLATLQSSNSTDEINTKIGSIFVVFDGFDSLQDIDATLLLKFLKLNELIDDSIPIQLKTIFIIKDIEFLNRYASFNIQTVIFPRYNYNEFLKILIIMKFETMKADLLYHLIKNLKLDPKKVDDKIIADQIINFITIMVQSFHMYTGNNIIVMDNLIMLKWDSYLQNLDETNYNDPVALYRANIKLFTSTDDTFTGNSSDSALEQTIQNDEQQNYELSDIAKYLLIAAYYCSYIDSKYDMTILSRKKLTRSGRDVFSRKKNTEKMIHPAVFYLERLLAVFQAIYPIERTSKTGSLASLLEEPLITANVEVMQNLAELLTLKLITATSKRHSDILSYATRYKINVPWEVISEVAKSVKFAIGQYFGN